MNILIVSFTFPPNKDGVSEAASAMAKGFLDRGWDVTIFTRVADDPREEFLWNGAHVTEFEYGGKYHRPQVIPKGDLGNYGNYLKNGDWDAIVFHAYDASVLCAIPHLGEISARKIIVSHGYAALIWEKSPKFPYGLGTWLVRFLRSIQMVSWMRRFDRIVYLSEQSDFLGFFDHLIAKVTRYKGRRVIPNGIALGERGNPKSDFRSKHGIPANAFVLICVANYSPRKDQAYGARAFRKAAVPGAVLVFIGSDFNEHSKKFQDEDKLSTSPSPPGTIIWLEKQRRDSTLNAIAACDSFLLSAYHEAQPISLLEAMRESKPWIARKAGCIASMEGGICVKSEAEMADAIKRIANDQELRDRLGREGRQAVTTRYNRKTYTESYCQLIEELV